MIVIVGAGYAGAATAWALARRGAGARVTLLEAECGLARHASGRNAGLIGPILEEDPAILEIGARGAARLREMHGYEPCGSILLCDEPKAALLQDRARAYDVPCAQGATSDLARVHPLLEDAASPVAVRLPADGKVDPAGLLRRFVDEARAGGVTLLTDARATGLRWRAGRLEGVETTRGPLPARQVVNAAGAAAGPLGTTLGSGVLSDLGLSSYRRHLFLAERTEKVDPGGPWVWDLSHDVYFRLDPEGITLCPCDEEPHAPTPPAIAPEAAHELARRLDTAFPVLARLARTPRHACLRTYAADRRYVVGEDPRLAGYFWVAGLGGSGATASAAVGDLAAGILLDTLPHDDPLRRAFDPARLIPPSTRL